MQDEAGVVEAFIATSSNISAWGSRIEAEESKVARSLKFEGTRTHA